MRILMAIRKLFSAPPPEPWLPTIEQANARFVAGAVDEAEELFLKTLQFEDKMPSDTRASVLDTLLWIWNESGRHDHVIEFATSRIAARPDKVLLEARADAYWYAGQIDAAIADYSTILQKNPECYGALSGRGQALAEAGRFGEALRDLDLAINHANNDSVPSVVAYPLSGRAVALAGLGQTDAALDEFARSLALCPENAWVFYHRAKLHEQCGEKQLAIADYEDSLIKREPPLPPRMKANAQVRLRALLESKI